MAPDIYLAINLLRFTKTEYLFKASKGEQRGLSSAGYTSQLKDLYLRLNHANAHGIRRGGAMYANSGTTTSPSSTAVAWGGECSMVKVLDVYWH